MQDDVWVFGRRNETQAICAWIAADDSRAAALLVGSAGIGKSSILRKCEWACIGHKSPHWFVQHAQLNANEDPSAFLHRVMLDTHALFTQRYLGRGPNDARILSTLLKSVPSFLGKKGACLGELLALLVGKEDTRPAWQRFCQYLTAISGALKDDERYVLLVDPLRAMKDEHAEEWLSVSSKLPPRVRILIAQRPDDCIAAHAEAHRHFAFVPPGPIPELPAACVVEWYEAELSQRRLQHIARHWSHDNRQELPRRAIERYRGHPFAHDAFIRLLRQTESHDPLADLAQWPSDLKGLLDALLRTLRDIGDDYYRAALTLQVFTIPAPIETWAAAMSVASEKLLSMVETPAFRHFFQSEDDKCYRLYHPLFAERLQRDLERIPKRSRELSEACWAAIEPELDPERAKQETPPLFHLRAALPVAKRTGDSAHAARATNAIATMKLRAGLLDELLHDLSSMLAEPDDDARASALGNLANILIIRGDLEQAESLLLKSLEIEQKLKNMEGLATAYGNLGVIYRMRGDLNEAHATLTKAIEIDQEFHCREGCARHYSNLSLVYQIRGDFALAEEMLRKSLDISEELGRLEDIACGYGGLGLIHKERGELLEAEAMHRKALDIYAKLGAPVGIAVSFANLGVIQENRGELADAEALYRKALEIDQQLGRLEGIASAYSSLGQISEKRHVLAKAEYMHRKSLEVEEQLGNREGIGREYGNLARIQRWRGDLSQAELLHRKALSIAEELGLRGAMASESGNLALIYRMRGDLTQAEALHQKALAIDLKLGRTAETANHIGNLGVIHAIRGELEEAEQAWLKAHDLFSNCGMRDKAEKVWRWLEGLVAERSYQESLQSAQKEGDQLGMVTAYTNLGLIYQNRGDLEQAESALLDAMRISDDLGRMSDIAFQCGNLGLVYREKGDLARAEQMQLKSLTIEEKLERVEGIANNCGNLGVIYMRSGNLPRAKEVLGRAKELYGQLRMPQAAEIVDGLLGALAPVDNNLDI